MPVGNPGRPRRSDLSPEERERLNEENRKKNERRRKRRLDPEYKAMEVARQRASQAKRRVKGESK